MCANSLHSLVVFHFTKSLHTKICVFSKATLHIALGIICFQQREFAQSDPFFTHLPKMYHYIF